MPTATSNLTLADNYINGQWVRSASSEWLDVTNPATGETIGKTPLSSEKEVDVAVQAASAALVKGK